MAPINFLKLRLEFQIFSLFLLLLNTSSKEFKVDKSVEQVKFRTQVIIGEPNKTYISNVNSSVELIFQYTFNASSFGRDGDIRVHTNLESDQILKWPAIFVVRQEQNVLSWQLPHISKSSSGKTYTKASRTLCNEDNDDDLILGHSDKEHTIYVAVSTASYHDIRFQLKVSVEESFVMTLGREYNTSVSPPSPRFYRFLFPKEESSSLSTQSSQYVLLEVFANDLTCMTVSIQNSTCPVFDEESNVQFEGYWQTMSMKAGMTLRRNRFPLGFYVVFVVHSDDSRCVTQQHVLTSQRKKSIRFIINEKISYNEYLAAIFGLIGIFIMIYIFTFVISFIYCCRNVSVVEFPIDGGSTLPIEGPGPSVRPITNSPNANHRKNNGEINEEGGGSANNDAHWLMDSDSSLDETDIDMLPDASRDKDIYRTTTSLCVSALAKKNPRVLAKKSQLYLWTLVTVAIFYALPVVQLVFTYQNVLHTTGNQDLCYYNYLCSHPLWILSDFNHVYSNIGYIMLGFLFLFLVYRRDRMHQKLVLSSDLFESNYGVPRHFGLFYAMGLALIMEGVLSACYHVCPNGSNFQFDTCFMYVISLMCILKIYQTRHPDINASAYVSFASLAFIILIGVLGVMAGNIYFWGLFTTLHIIVCLFLSFQIYYLGRWRLDSGLLRRVYGRWKNDCLASPLTCLRPNYIDRLILLIFANLSNWAIAAFGIYKRSHDFASHLLLIFMANLFIYTFFYIIMKLSHREKIMMQPLIYIALTCIFWSFALIEFLQKSTSWQMTPAQSRTFNRECLILRFYDTHDIWHVISAIGLFVWYMVLLTLDDDLIHTPRDKIAVF